MKKLINFNIRILNLLIFDTKKIKYYICACNTVIYEIITHTKWDLKSTFLKVFLIYDYYNYLECKYFEFICGFELQNEYSNH